MKPLNLEEIRLKEEMKSRCLNKGQYIDENAKAKFDMICHLEDFEVQYWNLEQENQKYKEAIDKLSKIIHEIDELRKTTGGYPSNYIDYLLDILKEVE